jgi:hypothetical protein
MPTNSVGSGATGIQGLADVMDMQLSTHCDGSTFDDPFVEVDVVEVTGSDVDLQDREEPTFETSTGTGGDH